MTAAVLPTATSQSATSPTVEADRAGDDRQAPPGPIRQPAAERCGDRAQPGDAEQDQPGRLGRAAQEPLDEERDEDERRVQDDRRAAGPRRTAALNGRLANSRGSTAGRSVAQLEPDEQHDQRHDGDDRQRSRAAPSPGAADRDQEGDQHRRQQDEARRRRCPGVRTRRPAPARRRRAGRTTTPTTIAAKSATGTASRNSDCQPNATDEHAADERTDGGARRDQHVEQAERRAAAIGRRHRPDQGHRASSTPARR